VLVSLELYTDVFVILELSVVNVPVIDVLEDELITDVLIVEALMRSISASDAMIVDAFTFVGEKVTVVKLTVEILVVETLSEVTFVTCVVPPDRFEIKDIIILRIFYILI